MTDPNHICRTIQERVDDVFGNGVCTVQCEYDIMEEKHQVALTIGFICTERLPKNASNNDVVECFNKMMASTFMGLSGLASKSWPIE